METRTQKARVVRTAKAPPAAAAASTRSSRKLQIGIGTALVLMLSVWWLRADPRIAKVREMRNELFAKSDKPMSAEEKKERFAALRAEEEKLSPDARKELRKEMGEQMQEKRSAEAVAYLSMSPAERRKMIDQRLAKEKAMTQQMQKKPVGPAAASGKAPTGGTGVAPPPGAFGANPGAPGGPGGPQGKQASTPESRDDRRRNMLIHVSPQARAGMDQMRADMALRRAQLGLPAPTGGGKRP
jgi:hypothetical protein